MCSIIKTIFIDFSTDAHQCQKKKKKKTTIAVVVIRKINPELLALFLETSGVVYIHNSLRHLYCIHNSVIVENMF